MANILQGGIIICKSSQSPKTIEYMMQQPIEPISKFLLLLGYGP